MNSVRTQLLLALMIAIALLMAAAVVMSYQSVSYETEELYDAELAQSARVLESLLSIELDFAGPVRPGEISPEERVITAPNVSSIEEYDQFGHKYEKKLAFRVWSRKGTLLLGSGEKSGMLEYAPQRGFAYEEAGGDTWRTFTLFSEPLALWIKVAHRLEIREELTHKIAVLNTSALLLVMPFMVLLVYLIVRWGFKPVLHISNEVANRGAHNLDHLSFTSVPAELKPLVNEINRLMAELSISLERQKRFTSNAAHELRTPLAAIKVHAQNLFPEDERTLKIQQNIVQGIDRLAHMFNQLITLSRMEAADREYLLQPVVLRALVQEVLLELQSEVQKKQQQIALDLPDSESLETNRDVLHILLRNLIGNAVRYTPEQGRIKIEMLSLGQGTGIVISDSGPGLSTEQKKLVFDRFYRASGQNSDGCGIGLSIVSEICEHFDYQIALLDSAIADTGLRVELCFKQPPEINKS